MTETVENLIIEHLRAIRGDVTTINNKLDILTMRVASVEEYVTLIHRDMTNIQLRMDHHEQRLDRIEKRLELTS